MTSQAANKQARSVQTAGKLPPKYNTRQLKRIKEEYNDCMEAIMHAINHRSSCGFNSVSFTWDQNNLCPEIPSSEPLFTYTYKDGYRVKFPSMMLENIINELHSKNYFVSTRAFRSFGRDNGILIIRWKQ